MADPFMMRTKAGLQANADGAEAMARGDRQGGLCTSDLQPRYFELAARGFLFSAGNVAAQATTVALATTYTGLCLSNPNGTTKNLALIGVSWADSAAPATLAPVHLIGGYGANVTHTTPLAAPGIQSTLINGAAASVAKADSAATIVNPYYVCPLKDITTTGAVSTAGGPCFVELAGMFVIPPGGWVAIGTLTVRTGFGGFVWAELPI